MPRKEKDLTRHEIIQAATRMFLEIGYSSTSSRALCSELGISPGTFTHYFPAKEDILAVLIGMLADFHWKTVTETVNEGETAITAICLELTAMAAMCEESEIARDIYISAYTLPKPLDIIRKNDAKRAKIVFAEFCVGWSDEMFAEAETLVSGIEYATLMKTSTSAPLETRISGAMNTILNVYNVPIDRRKRKIEKSLGMDYRMLGRKMLSDFKQYVSEMTEIH